MSSKHVKMSNEPTNQAKRNRSRESLQSCGERLQRFGCPAPPSAACELMPQAEGVSREV